MTNQGEPIAKKQKDGQIEYTCPICGGWDRLCEVYYSFLPFIDHLIRDLCVLQHPMLKQPKIVGDEIWYQVPGTSRLLPGLPRYDPECPEWKELLGEKQKILPQAKLFLCDIGDWLEKALASLEELNLIRTSNLMAAEILVSLVEKLREEFVEQKAYLLRHEDHLEQTGTDPKWLARPGNQARFVADSMAGARWQLTTSTSREMIRATSPSERKEAFKELKISANRNWWKPLEE